jgi:hypothetical protein
VTKIDNPLNEIVEDATEGEGRPDEQAAEQALQAVRQEVATEAAQPPKRSRGRPRKDGTPAQPAAPAVEQPGNTGAPNSAGAVRTEVTTRTTKVELRDALEKAERELHETRARLQGLEASSNGEAVENLATTIQTAIEMASSFVAAKRGPHWQYSGEEAQALGKAWSVVMAKHAQKINEHAPLAVAVAVTWQGVYARVQIDRARVAELAAQQDVATPPDEQGRAAA